MITKMSLGEVIDVFMKAFNEELQTKTKEELTEIYFDEFGEKIEIVESQ